LLYLISNFTVPHDEMPILGLFCRRFGSVVCCSADSHGICFLCENKHAIQPDGATAKLLLNILSLLGNRQGFASPHLFSGLVASAPQVSSFKHGTANRAFRNPSVRDMPPIIEHRITASVRMPRTLTFSITHHSELKDYRRFTRF